MKPQAIEQLLPDVFRRTLRPGDVLSTLIEVMAAMHLPSEAVIEEIERYFDPYRTPDRFVPFLASWVDLDRFLWFPDESESLNRRPLPLSIGRLRELIAMALELSQWRGTSFGLRRLLETATGVKGFEIDEWVVDDAGVPIPFHIAVHAPAQTASHRSLIERILEQEKPVYVTYELNFVS